MPNAFSTVKPRYKIRWSWSYYSWTVQEFYPDYTMWIKEFGTWQECVDYLRKQGW